MTGGTQRTITHPDDSSVNSRTSSAYNSSKASNSKFKKNEKMKKKTKYADVGTMCDILQSKQTSPTGTRRSSKVKGGSESKKLSGRFLSPDG